MAWRASGIVDQRRKFIAEYESGEWTMAELCRAYEISRQSGYKWVRRSEQEGQAGLLDRSRVAHHHPHQVGKAMEQKILAWRLRHPTWGARKLRHSLQEKNGKLSWPALSTFGEILKRAGLTRPQRQRRRTPPYTQPLQLATQANGVWCADFKGWFLTGDGQRVDPLTITDGASRYLLRCQIVEKTNTETVRAIFESTFRGFGLPMAIRTDNGPPFATRAIAGLSPLALYWMKLGIVPERIDPGHPEQNGRHERMHRTLKAETAQPPAGNPRAQQKRFDRFLTQFNTERPHEALQMKTPAKCYEPSPRSYPNRVPEPEYPATMQVRKVRACGCFGWKGDSIFLSEVLRDEPVGLEQVDEDLWRVHFATFPIALFDSHQLRITALPKEEKAVTSDQATEMT